MGVQVAYTVFVLMNVDMRPLPPQPVQNIGTEQQDHYSNSNFEHDCHVRRDAAAEYQQQAADRDQRHRMSQTPETAAQHEFTTRSSPGAHSSDSGEVVRFQSMLHADQTTKK